MSRQFNTLEGPVASSMVLSTAISALTKSLILDSDAGLSASPETAAATYCAGAACASSQFLKAFKPGIFDLRLG